MPYGVLPLEQGKPLSQRTKRGNTSSEATPKSTLPKLHPHLELSRAEIQLMRCP